MPVNESFISPRHHVNTTVAQTSTRYENSCRHEFHVGSYVKGLLVPKFISEYADKYGSSLPPHLESLPKKPTLTPFFICQLYCSG